MQKVSKHIPTVNISNKWDLRRDFNISFQPSIITDHEQKGATTKNNGMLGPVRTTMCWTGVGVMARLHWRFLLRFQVRFPRVIYWRFRGDTLHAAKSRLKLQKKLPV